MDINLESILRFVKEIPYASQKKELESMISLAEIESSDGTTTSSASEILGNHAKNYRKLSPKKKYIYTSIEKILREISKGKKKSVAYRDYLPKDVVTFLIELDKKKGVNTSEVFQEYMPKKAIGDKLLSKIKTKLKISLLGYAFFVLIAGNFVGTFSKMGDIVKFSENTVFIMTHFYTLAISWGVILSIGFLGFTSKMPIISKVFRLITGMLVFSSAKLMLNTGQTFEAMRENLRETFGIRMKKSVKVKGVVLFATAVFKERMITDTQASQLIASAEGGDAKVTMEKINQGTVDAIESLNLMIDAAVKNISFLYIAFPLVAVIMILTEFLEVYTINPRTKAKKANKFK